MSNILEDLTALFIGTDIPIETAAFTGKPPNKYIVFTPVYEDFTIFGDNKPIIDTQWVRISLFDRNNYIETKDYIVNLLLVNDFYIVERTYVEYENDTKYHHFAIDVQKFYERVN